MKLRLAITKDGTPPLTDFGKAYMGERGMLVVHCSNQPAQQMYTALAGKVPNETSHYEIGTRGWSDDLDYQCAIQ